MLLNQWIFTSPNVLLEFTALNLGHVFFKNINPSLSIKHLTWHNYKLLFNDMAATSPRLNRKVRFHRVTNERHRINQQKHPGKAAKTNASHIDEN